MARDRAPRSGTGGRGVSRKVIVRIGHPNFDAFGAAEYGDEHTVEEAGDIALGLALDEYDEQLRQLGLDDE